MKSAFGCSGRMKTVRGQKQIGHLADERLKMKDLTRATGVWKQKRNKNPRQTNINLLRPKRFHAMHV